MIQRFLQELRVQRWDDHRYYHHCRINQSLHLISAISFLIAYCMLFVNPAWAAIIAWCVSMTTRQAGHFFFEPRGYDHVNQVTDKYKEEIKVGYNIRRKIVLMGLWAVWPATLLLDRSLLGLIEPSVTWGDYAQDLGLGWLALGVSGLILRVIQLTVTRDFFTGSVWACKIVTDPFHDIVLYHKAPLALLRGERIAPSSGSASHP